jgi:hypothetical protein
MHNPSHRSRRKMFNAALPGYLIICGPSARTTARCGVDPARQFRPITSSSMRLEPPTGGFRLPWTWLIDSSVP